MSSSPRSGRIATAITLYRRLLWVYPPAHREAYGKAMVQLFGDLCRDACRSQGRRGLVRLWPHILIDIVRTAIHEHIDQIKQGDETMTRRQWFVTAISAGFPLFLWLLGGFLNPVFMGRLIATHDNPAQPLGWLMTLGILILVGAAGILQYRHYSTANATSNAGGSSGAGSGRVIALSIALIIPATLLVLLGPALMQVLALR